MQITGSQRPLRLNTIYMLTMCCVLCPKFPKVVMPILSCDRSISKVRNNFIAPKAIVGDDGHNMN